MPGLRHAARRSPSESPQAQRERAYIERLIAQCRSKDEVKRALVAEFGDRVLALPGDEGDTSFGDVLVYVVPALGIVLAAAGIASRSIALAPRRARPAAAAALARRPTAPGSTTTWSATTCDRRPTRASTPRSSPRSPSASSPSSRRACCRSCRATSRRSRASRSRRSRRARAALQVLGPALLFCLAFTAMFVALGMTATGLGQTLQDHRAVLRQISGIVIAALGLFFIATLFVPKLNREWRPEELMRARAHRRADHRRARVRGRVAALHRPDARRHPHRRLAGVDGRPRRRPARLLRARPGGAVHPERARVHDLLRRLQVLPQPLHGDHRRVGRDPGRDGRAALHERAHHA